MMDVTPNLFRKIADGKPLKQVLPEHEWVKTKQRQAVLLDDFGKMGMQQAAEHLISNGFCLVPASAKYHGAQLGGLFEHSRNVAMVLEKLTIQLGLIWYDEYSPIRIGWLHDLCKIDSYEITGVNPDGGYFFSHSEPLFPFGGHAVKSLALCQAFNIKLTQQEVMCIRFHMGAYEQKDWNDFDKAIKNDINVLYTHTADMIASRKLES